MTISAKALDFRQLNEQIKAGGPAVRVDECCGQRFIGSGLKDPKTLSIHGTPGNALGAYLDGGMIEVHGNTQDAVGDTMNGGKIVVHGSAGDALGLAMRGGSIYVRDNAGYRTGIHMKQYRDKKPVIVIGGSVGSFLGEYLAGGLIVVLGLGAEGVPVGNFTGTGMHGGKIFIRTQRELAGLPAQVTAEIAAEEDLREIEPEIKAFAAHFGMEAQALLQDQFYMLRSNAKNPYQRLYTSN